MDNVEMLEIFTNKLNRMITEAEKVFEHSAGIIEVDPLEAAHQIPRHQNAKGSLVVLRKLQESLNTGLEDAGEKLDLIEGVLGELEDKEIDRMYAEMEKEEPWGRALEIGGGLAALQEMWDALAYPEDEEE